MSKVKDVGETLAESEEGYMCENLTQGMIHHWFNKSKTAIGKVVIENETGEKKLIRAT